MSIFIDLIGQKFGRLAVKERSENDKEGKVQWLCLCDCGELTIVRRSNLRSGNVNSCGCLQKELASQRAIKNFTTHKHTNTSTYGTWKQMIQRCTNPKHIGYKYYGGRGIKVCKRWLKFKNFLEDMGERPLNRSIDRINNNLGYCKENCRWATNYEQSTNKRNNLLFTYNGKTKLLIEWAKEYNINLCTLWYRIYKAKWTIEQALTTSVRKHKKI